MAIGPIQIIKRAVVAGICGGLLAALFIAVVAEQSIDAAIAIENAAVAEAATDSGQVDDAEPLVSRQVQVIGGLAAAVLYGALIGVVFGTVFTAVRHRIRAADDFRRSLLLAAAASLPSSSSRRSNIRPTHRLSAIPTPLANARGCT